MKSANTEKHRDDKENTIDEAPRTRRESPIKRNPMRFEFKKIAEIDCDITYTILCCYSHIEWFMKNMPEALAKYAGLSTEALASLQQRTIRALDVLENKPHDGDVLRRIISTTFLVPYPKTILNLSSDLFISERQYYRLRNKAEKILAMQLSDIPKEEKEALMIFIEFMAQLSKEEIMSVLAEQESKLKSRVSRHFSTYDLYPQISKRR